MNDEEKRDRQMMELLNELRVALPGVQFLLALFECGAFCITRNSCAIGQGE